MIKTIAAIGLPVDEALEIRKNRIAPENSVDDMKRISIVTGIHGDELEILLQEGFLPLIWI